MKSTPDRRPFFRAFKCIARLFVRKPKWKFTSELPQEPCIYISNHSAASGPATYELYFPGRMRAWGTHEMCGRFKLRWEYLNEIYFPNKKGCRKGFSFLLATVLTPILAVFYKEMRIIPSYPDYRLMETVKTSIAELEKGVNILIFPENSSDGYHEVLTEFFGGFLTLAKRYCMQTGKDIRIVNMYYHKKSRKVVVGEPRSYLGLTKLFPDKEKLLRFFLDDTNGLYRTHILGEAPLEAEESA